MKCVETGEQYRIFKNYILGIFPYYILEDSRQAQYKGGVWKDVKITDCYFKTLEQVRSMMK
jgi:hypothetical protein|tara:strand:+ start:2804 stop:2986 length:183 start_codon:yes stop_codon:yes gene_type:complete